MTTAHLDSSTVPIELALNLSSVDTTFRCLNSGISDLNLRDCLELMFRGRHPQSRRSRTARGLLSSLAPNMDEESQMRAIFTTLESAAATPVSELKPLSSTDKMRLLAAFEFARRYQQWIERTRRPGKPVSKCLDHVEEALARIDQNWRNMAVEWLGFVPIYSHTKIGQFCVVAKGVRTHVNIDPSELFARVLVLRPRGFILFHNHPSGDLTPSEPDRDLTERVDEICKKLGIKLAAHLIVSGPNHVEVPMRRWS